MIKANSVCALFLALLVLYVATSQMCDFTKGNKVLGKFSPC